VLLPGKPEKLFQAARAVKIQFPVYAVVNKLHKTEQNQAVKITQ
jgi:hypothetical protein